MGSPLKKIESGKNIVWITQPNEEDHILKRSKTAYNIAIGKLNDSGGKIETVMQTAEAFGRGLFEDYIKAQEKEWTMEKWVKPLVDSIFNPMGTGATFTKIDENEAKSFIFRCRLHEEAKNQNMASVFTYGFLRGILLSAFPNGELLMQSTIAEGAPTINLIFKANAEPEDMMERERIKRNFSTT